MQLDWRNGKALALMAAVTASLKAVLVKFAYVDPEVDAIMLLFLRMSLALPFFLLMWWRSPPMSLTSSQWLRVFAVGFCGYYFSSYCDFVGLQYISAGLERLVLFSYPTMVLLLQAAWKRRWPERSAWISVALCYGGMLAAMSSDLQQQQSTSEVWTGSAWVFISGLSMAVYFLFSASLIKALGANRLTGMGCAVAWLLVTLHFTMTHSFVELGALQLHTWLYALTMAIVCTVMPSWLISSAIARIGASKTATIGNLGPVLTLFLAWMILDEPFTLLQAFGLGLVILGIQMLDKSKTSEIKKGE